MDSHPRMSPQVIRVLGAFMARRRAELSGADIAQQTKLASGTLYPILFRLEEAGWLRSQWEVAAPMELGRPRRRFYRMTAEGAKSVQRIARELAPAQGKLAWS
jgi:PadR family transcriptional regulator, regulatory protein PadR